MRQVTACESCRFFAAESDEGGTCRRRAPRASDRGTPVWPIVHQEYWCGEFVMKPRTPARVMANPTARRNIPEAT